MIFLIGDQNCYHDKHRGPKVHFSLYVIMHGKKVRDLLFPSTKHSRPAAILKMPLR